jgi:hypothetical protein
LLIRTNRHCDCDGANGVREDGLTRKTNLKTTMAC